MKLMLQIYRLGTGSAAAFRRLCVETFQGEKLNDYFTSSRLQAAVC